ncbi:malectin domain-containing carbohydrate-binding protein [Marinicellulosiphila megalodicopiae]|uniref:malectin domain-containing carbohydrate-binding protein n=1 Tax=Marinicellulosiphila megalodicopiae TaxID=2724896 RepID=UPI003BAFAC42
MNKNTFVTMLKIVLLSLFLASCGVDPALETSNTDSNTDTQTSTQLGSFVDLDKDLIADDIDQCLNTPLNTAVDATGCPLIVSNEDKDMDGVLDNADQCPQTPLNSPVDARGCIVNAAMDADLDGVFDEQDLCPNTPLNTIVGVNGCKVDVAMDSDLDGIQNSLDDCANTSLDEVADNKGCSDIQIGERFFKDSTQNCQLCHGTEGKGFADTPKSLYDTPLDICVLVDCTDLEKLTAYMVTDMPKTKPEICTIENNCADTISKYMIKHIVQPPKDADEDGISDNVDQCLNTPQGLSVDADGCADVQKDSDNDGVNDNLDTCPNTALGSTVNAQGCADTTGGDDADNDGVLIPNDACPNTPASFKDVVGSDGCSSYDRGFENYFSKLGGDKSCADCHGNEGQGGNGGGTINGICITVNCQDLGALTTYISQQMPYGNSNLCGESASTSCSSDIASFMNEAFYSKVDDGDFDGISDDEDMCLKTNSEDLKSIDHTGCVVKNGTTGSVYAINVGGDAFTTQAGVKYKADQETYYEGSLGSTMGELTFDVLNTDDDQLYRKERWGKNLTYTIPVPNGVYSVELHFSEVFFTEAGKREIDASIEGVKVLTGYDPFVKTGGKNYAGFETFENITIADQNVTIFLEGIVNNASIVGINILGELTNDGDSDGVDDKLDSCPGTTPNVSVNEQGCSNAQLDKDGDGILLPLDQCENTREDEVATVATSGYLIGCSERVRNIDTDNDGIADVADNCPATPEGSKVGVTGCTGLKTLSAGKIVSPQFRLTKREYINTVMRAFAVDNLPVATFLEDTSGPFSAYSNNAADKSADFSSLLGSSQTLADELANQLVDLCDWDVSPRNCVTAHIQGALKILYRENTYLDSDKESVGLTIAAARNAGADEQAALATALTFALVDDRMVYQMEFGSDRSAFGKAKLTDREFINRLSFMLVDNSPDAPLISNQVGIVDDVNIINDQTNRLMNEDAYKEMVWQFVAQWLRIAVDVPEITPSAPSTPIAGDQCNATSQCQASFPGVAQSYDCQNSGSNASICMCDGGRCDAIAVPSGMALKDAMQIETRLFVEYILDNNLPFTELFTAKYSFIDATLAEHYGVVPPMTDWAKYEFPDGVGRQGILTHASFLYHNGAHGRDVNTIFRGKIVYERLFCEQMPPPPPPEQSVALASEVSDRGVHPSCKGCHSVVDPIGRMFDLYDDFGKRFESAELHGGLYMDVDAAATFEGVVDFSSALEDSVAFKQCVSKQLFRFALGRDVKASEQDSFAQVQDALVNEGTLNATIGALVSSDVYKYVYSDQSTALACTAGEL